MFDRDTVAKGRGENALTVSSLGETAHNLHYPKQEWARAAAFLDRPAPFFYARKGLHEHAAWKRNYVDFFLTKFYRSILIVKFILTNLNSI